MSKAHIKGPEIYPGSSGRSPEYPAQAQAGAGRDLTKCNLKTRSRRFSISKESLQSALGIEAGGDGKLGHAHNEYFDVAKKVTAQEINSNQFIKKYNLPYFVSARIAIENVSRVYHSGARSVQALEQRRF